MRWLICLVLLTGIAQAGSKNSPTATPTMFPKPGKYVGTTSVKLESSTPGAVIHYTTDETKPNEDSLIYTEPILLRSTTKIHAIAIAPGHSSSEENEGNYQLETFSKFEMRRLGGG